ncbi:hypothetical protein Tharo_2791 [Thauera aromatica K172]|uniref:Uncharacterized protein n=1 Tax=Thauera aromatica K172 TaxID=44139 RepID=A0A2R4BR45_THAAR|nr:hypothetical protein Tharo_2791 [Thauera aromatica K172]
MSAHGTSSWCGLVGFAGARGYGARKPASRHGKTTSGSRQGKRSRPGMIVKTAGCQPRALFIHAPASAASRLLI